MKRIPIASLILIPLLAGCIGTKENKRLEPSQAAVPFDGSLYKDFDDYIAKTTASLKANKIYMKPENADQELQAIAPTELPPAASCDASESKGILLVHGLSDTPFAMRDLARALAERCFLVRSLLLPGHGTRAGDMLSVKGEDWLAAVRFGVKTLKADVKNVFVGGFSLGGALSAIVTTEDPSIKGLIAISPAFKLGKEHLVKHAVWLKHVWTWADKDLPDDFARYEAMPLSALAETYKITKKLNDSLETKNIATPIFLAQSRDDTIIDGMWNQGIFTGKNTSDLSRALVYAQNIGSKPAEKDARVKLVESYLPTEKIAGYSHQAVHSSPTNPYYGRNGTYRNCNIGGDRESTMVQRCLNDKSIWFAEMTGDSRQNVPADAVVGRLTFNPKFDELVTEIDAFCDRVIAQQNK